MIQDKAGKRTAIVKRASRVTSTLLQRTIIDNTRASMRVSGRSSSKVRPSPIMIRTSVSRRHPYIRFPHKNGGVWRFGRARCTTARQAMRRKIVWPNVLRSVHEIHTGHGPGACGRITAAGG